MFRTRTASALASGVVGAFVAIVFIATIYGIRLWVTGFPLLDVEQDVSRFIPLAGPFAVICFFVFAIARFVACDTSRRGIIVAMVVVSCGAGVSSALAGEVFPKGIIDTAWRVSLACGGAIVAGLIHYGTIPLTKHR